MLRNTRYSTAIGFQSKVLRSNSPRTGSDLYGTVVGFQSIITDSIYGAAFGMTSKITRSDYGTTFGMNTFINELSHYGTAIGFSSTIQNDSPYGTAIGFYSTIKNKSNYSTAIGNATIDGYYNGSYQTNQYNIGLGWNSLIHGYSENSILIGSTQKNTSADRSKIVQSSNSIGIGSGVQIVDSNQVTVIGALSKAYKTEEDRSAAPGSTIVGYGSQIYDNSAASLIVGSRSSINTNSNSSTVVGNGNTISSGSNGTSVLGSGSKTQQSNSSVMMGQNNKLSYSNGSLVIGYGSSIGEYSDDEEVERASGSNYTIVIGSNSTAKAADHAAVIGDFASATKEDTIVIGSHSTSGSDKGIPGWDPLTGKATTETSSKWVATNNAVSFGRAAEYDDDGNETLAAITRQINNVAAGSLDTDAVNVAQLKQAMKTQGFNFSAEGYAPAVTDADGNVITPEQHPENFISLASGGRLPVIGDGVIADDGAGNKVFKDSNINTTVAQDLDGTQAIQVALSDNIKLGEKNTFQEDGTENDDGVNGSVEVVGKQTDGVKIEARGDGGHIVLNGSGTAPLSADIALTTGEDLNNAPLTRIQYESGGNAYQLATLDDGTKYAGNFDSNGSTADADKVFPVALNGQVSIIGSGVDGTNPDNFVDGNIAVVSDPANSQLVIKMNKDIELPNGSINIPQVQDDGSTKPGIVISLENISMGGNTITNVASVNNNNQLWTKEDENGNPVPDDRKNTVANIGDLDLLKTDVSAAHTVVTVGDQAVSLKDGETEGTADGGNLHLKQTVKENGQSTYDLSLKDQVALGTSDNPIGSLTVNGDKGVELTTNEHNVGQITLRGDKRTQIDITIAGDPDKTLDPNSPNPGRIEYNDVQVATMDDGMKYAGNFNFNAAGETTQNIPVKLNNQAQIIGDLSKYQEEMKAEDFVDTAFIDKHFVDGNIAVVAKQDGDNAQLVIKMNKDLTLPGGSLTIGSEGDKNKITISQNTVDLGGNVIHNVGPAVDGNDVVIKSQLEEYVAGKANVKHTFHADNTYESQTGGYELGNEGVLNVLGDEKYLETSVDPDNNAIKIKFHPEELLASIPEGSEIHYFHVNSDPDLDNYLNNGADGGKDGIAIGAKATVSGNGGVAVGYGANVSVEGGVAVGYGSISNVKPDPNTRGYDIGGFVGTTVQPDNGPTWIATTGAFSVGASGDGVDSIITRRITNVAAGLDLTDAVNVAQLKLLKDYVDNKVDSSVGGGSSGGVAGGMVFGADDPAKEVPLDANQKLAVLGDGTNISTTITQGSDGKSASVKVQLKENIQVSTVDVGGGNVKIDKNGFTIGATGPNPIKITENNISMGDRVIHDVAPGVKGTDAVNMNQLNASNRQIFNKINDVDKNARAGIAQALATAGLPQAYLPGKSMMSAAAGTYDGQSGIAIGISSISDDGKWVIKGTASGNSQGKFGGSIGVGYLF